MKALHRLSNLDVSFVSLVNRAAVRDPSNPTEPMRFLLTKSEVPVVDMTPGGATNNTGGGRMPKTEAELRAALEKAEQKAASLREELEKAAKPTNANPDPDNDGDDDRTAAGDTDHDYHPAPKGGGKMSKAEQVAKAELEAIQKAAEERIQKAEERAAEAEKIAKEERDRRVLAERVEFAKSELPHVGDPQEVGAELVKLEQALSKEEYDAHVARQRALNEQIAKGDLFRQFGADGSPTASANEVAKGRERAAEIRKADPTLSEFDALRKAIRENPDLILANR